MSFHLSIETDRTNDKWTPSPRCFPEHSKQIHIPYVTETHCGLWAPHSKHFCHRNKKQIENFNFMHFRNRRCDNFHLRYFHSTVAALAKLVLFVDSPLFMLNNFLSFFVGEIDQWKTELFNGKIKAKRIYLQMIALTKKSPVTWPGCECLKNLNKKKIGNDCFPRPNCTDD